MVLCNSLGTIRPAWQAGLIIKYIDIYYQSPGATGPSRLHRSILATGRPHRLALLRRRELECAPLSIDGADSAERQRRVLSAVPERTAPQRRHPWSLCPAAQNSRNSDPIGSKAIMQACGLQH